MYDHQVFEYVDHHLSKLQMRKQSLETIGKDGNGAISDLLVLK